MDDAPMATYEAAQKMTGVLLFFIVAVAILIWHRMNKDKK